MIQKKQLWIKGCDNFYYTIEGDFIKDWTILYYDPKRLSVFYMCPMFYLKEENCFIKENMCFSNNLFSISVENATITTPIVSLSSSIDSDEEKMYPILCNYPCLDAIDFELFLHWFEVGEDFVLSDKFVTAPTLIVNKNQDFQLMESLQHDGCVHLDYKKYYVKMILFNEKNDLRLRFTERLIYRSNTCHACLFLNHIKKKYSYKYKSIIFNNILSNIMLNIF